MSRPNCDHQKLVCPCADWADKAVVEIARLQRIIHIPLSGTELKLVDKNCDWIAFQHAWNAIMKSRLGNHDHS